MSLLSPLHRSTFSSVWRQSAPRPADPTFVATPTSEESRRAARRRAATVTAGVVIVVVLAMWPSDVDSATTPGPRPAGITGGVTPGR